MPHYRDGHDEPPRPFIGLIEEVILPAHNPESVAAQFRFHDCGIYGVFGIRRLRSAIGNHQVSSTSQRVAQMREDNLWPCQLMIGIRHQYRVYRS